MANALAKTRGQGRTPMLGMGSVFGGTGGGFTPPPDRTYQTYRLMRCDPTIALARAVATAPIKAASWSVEAKDDARDDAVDLVMSVFMPMLPTLVRDCCFGLDYGWQPFEKVWEIRKSDGRAGFRKLKPLLPDITQIVVDQETGAFAGVKNGEAKLSPFDSLVYSHDMEGGDYYGRSRHENLRQYAWSAWRDTYMQAGKYMNKAAGIIPMVTYPVGESKGEDGRKRPNSEIAKDLLRNLPAGNGIAMPTVIDGAFEELLRQGVNPRDALAWRISFVEATGDHTAGFERMLRYFDSSKMRGWLVPERVALEGQHGTLAESNAHADVALSIAEETLGEIARHLNWYAVDDLLAVNFGEDARGTVELVPSPLVNEDRAFYRNVVTTMLTNPAAYETAQMMLDVDAILDVSGLPKSEEVVDPAAMPAPNTQDPASPIAASRSRRGWHSRGPLVMGRSAAEILRRVRELPGERAIAVGEVR